MQVSGAGVLENRELGVHLPLALKQGPVVRFLQGPGQALT